MQKPTTMIKLKFGTKPMDDEEEEMEEKSYPDLSSKLERIKELVSSGKKDAAISMLDECIEENREEESEEEEAFTKHPDKLAKEAKSGNQGFHESLDRVLGVKG